MVDVSDHCKSIDIVMEDMDSADVARIFGDAFIEGCRSGDPWDVMLQKRDAALDGTTADAQA